MDKIDEWLVNLCAAISVVLVALLLFILAITPSSADEIIVGAVDMATLKAAAKAENFSEDVTNVRGAKTGERIKHTDRINGAGAWAIVVADAVDGLPGVYMRMRWNGDPKLTRFTSFIANMRTRGLTVYERKPFGKQDEFGVKLMCWSSDGVSCTALPVDEVGKML